MKSLRRSFFVFIFLILCWSESNAQYFKAAGIRIVHPPGLSFKQFSHRYRGNALEVMLTSYQISNVDNFGYMLSAFYEHQKRLPLFKRLRFPFDYYFGFGAHVGYYSDKVLYGNDDVLSDAKSFSVGPDAIVGLERRFRAIPITLSIDFRPFYEISSKELLMDKGAITIRYILE